jgi:DNA topoisomerase-2
MADKKVARDIHDKYQKLSPREHVLLRPEMYIGAVVAEKIPTWVEGASGKVHRVEAEYSQAMLKVVDEILMNASDNVLEHAEASHPVTYISVTADRDSGVIAIENDGPGIPIVEHKEHKLWIPDMVFGHLLTGKNFHNDSEHMAAGRHGYGAKLTNIFSKSFSVMTRNHGQTYTQKWTGNMATSSAPKVIKSKGGETDVTRIEFTPDYEKLGMEKGLTVSFIAVLRKRCADLAVSLPDTKITFNGKPLASSFEAYIAQYQPTAQAVTTVSKYNRTQFVGVAFFDSPSSSLKGSHVSMVNSIVTHNGGTHLQHARSVVEEAAQKAAKAAGADGSKEFNLAKFMNHCIVFTSMSVPQPKFDSQSKVRMVSTHLWPKFDDAPLVEAFKKIDNMDKFFVSVFKGPNTRTTNSGKVRNLVTKAHDAKDAGTTSNVACTLLVTEGDSAAALALGSLSVTQRRTYGVFPVRGKVLNVLTDVRRVTENKEWMDLFTVMGLSLADRNPTLKKLRYQRIKITTARTSVASCSPVSTSSGLSWPRNQASRTSSLRPWSRRSPRTVRRCGSSRPPPSTRGSSRTNPRR